MDKTHYIGHFEKYTASPAIGRIKVIASLERLRYNAGNQNAGMFWAVKQQEGIHDLFPPEGKVFWPQVSTSQAELENQLVRFQIEKNWKVGPDKERFVVAARPASNNARVVDRIGFPVLPFDYAREPQIIFRRSAGLAAGAVAYRALDADYKQFDGPWRLEECQDNPGYLSITPKNKHFYNRWDSTRDVPSEIFLSWSDDRTKHYALLFDPDIELGEPIDLLPDSELVGWLSKALKNGGGLLHQIDEPIKNWRKRLEDYFNTFSDSEPLKLRQKRWERLRSRFEVLSWEQQQLAELRGSNAVKEAIDRACIEAVNRRRTDIETQARDQTKIFESEQRNKREHERTRLERETKAQERELQSVRSQIDAAKLELDGIKIQINEEKMTIHAAAEYLDTSRERIVRDFAAFQGLLGHLQPGRNGSASVPSVASPPVHTSERQIVAAVGPAIDDVKTFVEQRLAPTLSRWTNGSTLKRARLFHAAVLSCRWTLVPNPAWGIAYAEAIGSAATFRVVAVEPTWLTFDDAWKSEVGSFWYEAVQTPDVLHLLIFVDVDRGLPQCWARPWLDILAGFRPSLPPPSGQPWPDNLRVLACPTSEDDEAVLNAVPYSVVAYWAGVGAASKVEPSSETPIEGHTTFDAWKSWVPEFGQPMPPISPEAAGLGAAARAGTAELHRLGRALEAMGIDDSDQRAKEVRIDQPKEVFKRVSRVD